MYNLSDINVIKSVLAKNGFTFSKALGQNFLIDSSICPEMADEAVLSENDGIIEIGAGVGVLTQELCQRAKKVVSIELDSRLIPVLSYTLADFDNVEVLNQDVLKTDFNTLIKEKFADCENVSVCANLPYYITSPVIMKLLEDRLPIKQIVVMVQKEASQRLCAFVGARQAGAVTVAVNYYSKATELFDVSRTSFMPSPNVDSAVIKLEVSEKPTISPINENMFFQMVKSAFSQRRKTALNGISAGMSLPKEIIAKAIENTNLKSDIRAEKLTMQELCALSDEIGKLTADTKEK
ncbi:MAG: 16S rRNA (adenine(1518)-N(6)/adenine(1519)-N(6))-dimethyltransferase RsmA [Oscillospiraceae bacterium]